jgi:hypothetical protein
LIFRGEIESLLYEERVLYLFIMAYILLSFVFVTVVWHVGAELFKGLFSSKKPNLDLVETPVLSWCTCGVFGLLTVVYQIMVKEKMQSVLAGYFQNIRFWTEVGLVLLLCFAAVRKRKKGKA